MHSIGVLKNGGLKAAYVIRATKLLANEASPPFAIGFGLDAKLENERQSRRLSATRATREPQRATCF
jgi:hypothetical protein